MTNVTGDSGIAVTPTPRAKVFAAGMPASTADDRPGHRDEHGRQAGHLQSAHRRESADRGRRSGVGMTAGEVQRELAALRARVERLEDALKASSGWTSEHRNSGAPALRAVIEDSQERYEARLEAETERIRWDGSNVDELEAFAGDAATVRTDQMGESWLVGHRVDGRSIPLRRGVWLAKDPPRGAIYETHATEVGA